MAQRRTYALEKQLALAELGFALEQAEQDNFWAAATSLQRALGCCLYCFAEKLLEQREAAAADRRAR